MTGPTKEQIESYKANGFLVVEQFLDDEEVERLRGAFERVFLHDFETGIRPDEVNYPPGVTDPQLTRQMCNAWKSDRVIAATTLAWRNAAFAAELTASQSVRINQDNLIWKPPGGLPLLAHQDAAYLGYLDPPNMVTCWMALDDTSSDAGTIYYLRGSHRWLHAPVGGQFHAPKDWLAYARSVCPPGCDIELVPVEVPAGGAAFHDAWVFHGSPHNERGDAERRAVISHLMDGSTRFNPASAHPIYSRYRRPGSTAMDEAFFPVLWSADGYRSSWLEGYISGSI